MITKTAGLVHSRSSTDYAELHVNELKDCIDSFIQSKPYAIVAEDDKYGKVEILKVKLVKEFPEKVSFMTFNIINNLRSALDQAGYACAIAAGNNGKKAKFPFGDSIIEVESRRTSGSKDIPQNIFDIMIGCKPYRGGNDSIWAMNKICNSHKHQLVTPHFFTTKPSVIDVIDMSICGIASLGSWDSFNNEMIIATVPKGSCYDIHLNLVPRVIFGRVKVFAGMEVLGVLDHLINQVGKTLDAIEIEAISSGLF